ncbi:flagellar biosynthetic protein FliO [Antarcticirhabdus aurantiaca]|uniref:Flagellar biosynthetic protein FliO n=1 Tax=Antarcticirhabdus aurantiaca TaxID=2606717 RepID=A0ACD4NUZ6_9HYPH|nr:flagellar biosynthetic protein FliO [Antarcticirhabdus aurantiaca]WAJ30681.1 flagellar biosynthetic protein FliO [Jeongeuplla avenae]
MPQWLVDILGEDLAPIGRVALAALVVILLAMLMIWLAKKAFGGMTLGARGRQAPRLAVADILAVDDKRRLILVRRDETEHLVLVGGANDLLLESGIRQNEAVLAPRREPSLAPRPFATDHYVEDRDEEEDEPPAPRGAPERFIPPPPPPPPVRVESDRREPISASLAEALAAAAGESDRQPARRVADEDDDAAKTRRELEAALVAARASMPDLSAPSRAPSNVPPVPAPSPAERSLAENDGGAVPDEPTEPARRPLSVRSFATAIQNRRPGAPHPATASAPEPAPAAPMAPPAASQAPGLRSPPSQATPVAPTIPAPRPAAAAPQPAATPSLPPAPSLPQPAPASTPAPAGLQLRPPVFAPPQRAPSPAAPMQPLSEIVPPQRAEPQPVAPPAQAPLAPPVTVPTFSAPQPAPVAPSAPRPQAPAAVVLPPVGEASRPERKEPTIEDFLAAELDQDFRDPGEPARSAPVAAPEVRSPVETERSVPEPRQARPEPAEETPAAARKLTLEEEMERLLGDFSASTSFTTRR